MDHDEVPTLQGVGDSHHWWFTPFVVALMNSKFLVVAMAMLLLFATTVGAAIVAPVVGRSGYFSWTDLGAIDRMDFGAETEWTLAVSDTGTDRHRCQ